MNKYSVSELTKNIKRILEGTFNETISVVGEVSNLSRASSGHIYFSLKESNCQIRAAYFKRYAIGSNVFIPKNGDKVQVVGDISLYEADGSYQLIVKRVFYDSVGDYWQKFEETKKKLESEGLFNENRKRKLPLYPEKIALITSIEGAAIKDFISSKINSKGKFNVEIWNVPVQGVESKDKIITAINKAGSLSDRYDIIVVTRGGGSLEDLSVFNDEMIARAVFNSKVPVVSAIGHERDFTIIDFVADFRAATPTAAAYTLSENYLKLSDRINYLNNKVIEEIIEYIQKLYQKLDYIDAKLIGLSPKNKLNNYKNRLTISSKEIKYLMKNILLKYKDIVNNSEKVIENYNPLLKIKTFNVKIDAYEKSLKNILNYKINTYKNHLNNINDKLKILNPDNILNRGYAQIIKDGKIISSINNVDIKENIEIKMKDGYISSFVTKKTGG